MTASQVRMAVLYPELLDTYGDGGNEVVLRRRLQWRGLEADVVEVRLGQPVPQQCDLYVIGGGEDTAQLEALAQLNRGRGLQSAVARGAPLLAVCAGFQIVGTTLTDRDGRVRAGLDLIDARTVPRTRRAVGEVLADPIPALGLPALIGFENHGFGTRLGPAASPLATVVVGTGNGPPQGPDHVDGRPVEGAVQGSVVATYLHGPVLARNPALADLLLSRAVGRELDPLNRAEVTAARARMLERLHPSGRSRLGGHLSARLSRWWGSR